MWLRKLPIVPTIITLVCVVIMFALGAWQLERKAEKDARLVQISERKNSDPLSPFELDKLILKNSAPHFANDLQDYPITLSGQAFPDKLFYIDNKIHGGKVGFEIVMPVQLANTSSFILINMGWFQGTGSRGTRSSLPLLEKYELSLFQEAKTDSVSANSSRNLTFNGVVKYPSMNKMVQETNTDYGEFPVLQQQLNMAEAAKHLGIHSGQKLLTYIVNIDPNPSSNLVRNWQPVVMAPEKHLGYAAQWFGLGIAALTIYLLSVLKMMHALPKES